MVAALAKQDQWQWRYTAEWGATTKRINALGSTVPLIVSSGNLPIGSDAKEETFNGPSLPVTGPYAIIHLGFAADLDDFNFNGNIRLIRKTRSFSRDHLDTDFFYIDLDLGDYPTPPDSYIQILDSDVVAGTVYYYTIYWQNTDGEWAFSPSNSHAKTLVYSNTSVSEHGSFIYDNLPRLTQLLDSTENDLATERFVTILGRMFDLLKEDLFYHKNTMYDIDNTDSKYLPYIDWLLAWPTNYELSEEKRRIETKNAVTLWKAKGTQDALELVLQTVTGWNVVIQEGREWVVRTNAGPKLDPLTPPDDWDAGLDGNWASLVNAVPYSQTYNSLDPSQGTNRGTYLDKLTYTPDFTKIIDVGVGWWWQNLNGVLISLEQTPTSGTLSQTVVRKIYRVAPLFALHYAAFNVLVTLRDTEVWSPFGLDTHVATIDGVAVENYEVFDEDSALDSTASYVAIHTYPHPIYVDGSNTNLMPYVTHHSWLSYT